MLGEQLIAGSCKSSACSQGGRQGPLVDSGRQRRGQYLQAGENLSNGVTVSDITWFHGKALKCPLTFPPPLCTAAKSNLLLLCVLSRFQTLGIIFLQIITQSDTHLSYMLASYLGNLNQNQLYWQCICTHTRNLTVYECIYRIHIGLNYIVNMLKE